MNSKYSAPEPNQSQKIEITTERAIERQFEEQEFHSVIIKRDDQVSRHPDDMLEIAILEGQEQKNRSTLSLLLSSLSAGLILGFAAMAVAFAYTLVPEGSASIYNRLAMAFVYPLGFVITVISGSQLFTEHTALAVYPFLDRKTTLKQMLRLWGIVLGGNLLGTFLSSILIVMAEPVIHNKIGYIAVANHLIHFTWMQIFISAVLAGWLMALGGWLLFYSSSSSTQIICIYIVTFLIGIGGLHHSIAGSAEVFVAMFFDSSISLRDCLSFLTAAITGNIVGGSVMVATLNYGHIRTTQNHRALD